MAIRGRKQQLKVRRDVDEPNALPRCPAQLGPVARKEWRRLTAPLHKLGILTVADRAEFAAYCQAWERWSKRRTSCRRRRRC